MENVKGLLDIIEEYSKSLTQEDMDDLEADLNEENEGEGTRLKAKVIKVKEALAQERNNLKTYTETTKGTLEETLGNQKEFFETFRNNGSEKPKAVENMDVILTAVKKIHPLDPDTILMARILLKLVNDFRTKSQFGSRGNPQYNAFILKINPIDSAIKKISNARLEMALKFGEIYFLELNMAIDELIRAKKKLEAVNKALATFGKFISLIGKAAKIFL